MGKEPTERPTRIRQVKPASASRATNVEAKATLIAPTNLPPKGKAASAPPPSDEAVTRHVVSAPTPAAAAAAPGAGALPFDPKPMTGDRGRRAGPVSGWLVVVAGPGRGNSVEIGYGINRVGRGADQQISIDFGDEGVSRDRAAEIAYDAKTKTFTLLRGTSVNLVYVNEAAVYQPTPLAAGDIIQISATHLRFVPLCGADFTWEDQAR